MSNTKLRIHPAIGFARVGSSPDYYIAPETSAGLPIDGQQALTGGLPIKPGTESTPITSGELRDAAGRLKRQAARFRIYQYDDAALAHYPSGSGTEVVIGSSVDGKVVKDIVWTVHLANKKANCWIMESSPAGLPAYANGAYPQIRNAGFASSLDPSNRTRLQKLVIDAGPRAIKASAGGTVSFDQTTRPSYGTSTGGVADVPRYPISFPATDAANLPPGSGSNPITTLGEMTTERNGRLLVLGASGLACGFDADGRATADAVLGQDVDNDNWFDDTGDGPVTAWIVFSDGTVRAADSGAWVVSTDPSYAPQTRNIVTLWDEILTTWIENFALRPDIYDGHYRTDFRPAFDEHVFPILRAASLQMWNTNLPVTAMKSHDNIDKLTAAKPPFNIMSFIRDRDTNSPTAQVGSPLMPLALGDNQTSFLTLTAAQHFFVQQWANGLSEQATPASYGPGEALDRNVLSNCLGGRFSPGIDLTFIVRDPKLYNPNWTAARATGPVVGPFRINMRPLDYTTVSANQPFLGVGYFPLRDNPVEPGDLCKFMAIPWHTDYNSCSTHLPSPNPGGEIKPDGSNVYNGVVNTTLYWSWPAQRPVAVYTYDDLVANHGELPEQRYSLRGEGTAAIQQDSTKKFNAPAMNVGRYQKRLDILLNWDKIGFVIQGVAIDKYDSSYPPNYYLEVQSLFKKDYSNLVQPWPNTVTDTLQPPDNG